MTGVLIKHARPTSLGHQLIALDGRAVEHETFGCGHCGRTHVVPHRADPSTLGALCKGCMKLVCSACNTGHCAPLEQKFERAMREAEQRRRFFRQVG